MSNTTATSKVITESHTVCISKLAERSLQVKVIDKNLAMLLGSVNSKGNAARGWRIDADMCHGDRAWAQNPYVERGTNYEWQYELCLAVTYEGKEKPEAQEFVRIANTIATRCTQPQFGRWMMGTVDGKPWVPPTDHMAQSMESSDNPLLGYSAVEIPEDWDSFFDHLYGLGAPIERIRRAIEAGVMSDWEFRYNCALIGPPGCGKSDLCRSIKDALGEDAVMEFDATATTAAGAIKDLSEREILPRVVIIEEIEKAPEQSMSFLLGILDLRSQIRKTTARSAILRDTKLFAIATVNNYELFNKLQAGALASRFSNTIWFNRPNRDQLYLILEREINKVNGNIDWIEPTLDYCEAQAITDPRQVTSICLCGREMLLTGEYQKLLAATAKPEGK